jgi:hypothetical protein
MPQLRASHIIANVDAPRDPAQTLETPNDGGT